MNAHCHAQMQLRVLAWMEPLSPTLPRAWQTNDLLAAQVGIPPSRPRLHDNALRDSSVLFISGDPRKGANASHFAICLLPQDRIPSLPVGLPKLYENDQNLWCIQVYGNPVDLSHLAPLSASPTPRNTQVSTRHSNHTLEMLLSLVQARMTIHPSIPSFRRKPLHGFLFELLYDALLYIPFFSTPASVIPVSTP
ncbi:hypothetical protein ARMGADRAFT_1165986 [Armillaria gallica]|uniref:Uncharacterized protein n=1 Tax=Armillaria gallica TaxID=47427 RepID=A0A2H3DJU5_ARMGA|nr:hypothetical protein ARMGADRAFT_1165986 [Armillaria gallica]